MQNVFTEQVKLIDEKLKNKAHTFELDQKCVNYRAELQNSALRMYRKTLTKPSAPSRRR